MAERRKIEILALVKDFISGPLRKIGQAANGMGKSFKGARRPIQSFLAALTGIGALAGGIFLLGKAVRGLVRIFTDAARKASELQTSSVKLNAILKSTGGGAGLVATQLREMKDQLFATTIQTRAMIRDAEGLLLTFTDIGGSVFPAALEAAADMSAVFGQDLKQSMIQLGVALNDPQRGLSRLRRIGVSFSAEQERVIDALAATGDLAGAQREILAELNREFGGAAKAAMETFRGSLANVNKQWEEWKRGVGEVIIGSEALRTFLTDMGNRLGEFTAKVKPQDILKLVSLVLEGVGRILRGVAAIAFVITANVRVFQGLLGLILKGSDIVGRAIGILVSTISGGFGAIAHFFGGLVNMIHGGLIFVAGFVSNLFAKMAATIKRLFLVMSQNVLLALLGLVEKAAPLFEKIGIDVSSMSDSLEESLDSITANLADAEIAMGQYAESVEFHTGTAGDAIADYGQNVFDNANENTDVYLNEASAIGELGEAWVETARDFLTGKGSILDYIRLVDDLGLSALDAAKQMGLIPDSLDSVAPRGGDDTTDAVVDTGREIAKAFGAEFRLSLASALGKAVEGGGDIGRVLASSIGAEIARSITDAKGGIFGGLREALGAGATAFLGPVIGGLATGLLGSLLGKKKKVKPEIIPVRVVNFEDLTGELLRASARRRIGPPQINSPGGASLAHALSGEVRF